MGRQVYQDSWESSERGLEYYRQRASGYDSERSRNWEPTSAFRTAVREFCWRPLSSLPIGGLIADLGIGTGRTALVLPSLADAHFLGIDFSINMLRVLKTRGGEHLRLCSGNIHALPLRANCVDGIYLVSVLQYLNLDKALQEVSRITRPDAWVIVGVICLHPDDTEGWRDKAFQDLVPRYLGRFRQEREIIQAFEAIGMRLAQHETFTFRRRFKDLYRDRSSNSESPTLDAGLKIWSAAPGDIRKMYSIGDDGFDQRYTLFRFQL